MGKSATLEQVEAQGEKIMSRCDKDEDGVLAEEEFIHWYQRTALAIEKYEAKQRKKNEKVALELAQSGDAASVVGTSPGRSPSTSGGMGDIQVGSQGRVANRVDSESSWSPLRSNIGGSFSPGESNRTVLKGKMSPGSGEILKEPSNSTRRSPASTSSPSSPLEEALVQTRSDLGLHEFLSACREAFDREDTSQNGRVTYTAAMERLAPTLTALIPGQPLPIFPKQNLDPRTLILKSSLRPPAT